MIEGFWTVEFVATVSYAGGVAVLIEGQVLGGDSSYMYTGNYALDGTQMKATIDATPFVKGAQSVFGHPGVRFQLDLQGHVANGVIEAEGHIVGQKALAIRMRLTKRAELPVKQH